MKLLKKCIAVVFAAFSVFACACTGNQVSYTLFGGSFWLNSTEIVDVGTVNETCVYDITLTPAEKAPFTAEYDDGTALTTKLTNYSENGKNYYKFTVEMVVKGRYKFGDTEVPVDDSIVSECIFSGLKEQFYPLRSSKTVTSTSVNYYENSLSFTFFSYKQTVEYSDDKKATVKIEQYNEMPESLKTEELKALVYEAKTTASEDTYDKLGSPFIDNELMLFFPRAAELTAGFSVRYNSLDALAKTVRKMSVSVSSEKSDSEIKLSDYSINGSAAKEKTIVCSNATIAISDSFSGSAQNLYFAKADAKNENKRRLVQMETQLPYLGGKMVYTLRSVTYGG